MNIIPSYATPQAWEHPIVRENQPIPRARVIIERDNWGDDDCYKWHYSVMLCGKELAGFRDINECYRYCRENEYEIIGTYGN